MEFDLKVFIDECEKWIVSHKNEIPFSISENFETIDVEEEFLEDLQTTYNVSEDDVATMVSEMVMEAVLENEKLGSEKEENA